MIHAGFPTPAIIWEFKSEDEDEFTVVDQQFGSTTKTKTADDR